ncbi:MAG: N-acetyl-alpha-D-glucosaminyl L-malate synthase BshA [Bacillota bacterium]|nr:N-acetyl-alpha-D-glucosaminyl L-malate synthase BshA [Bacillota bacterium]
MRIGITCYPSIGGSGVVATELGKQLAERGHQVHFITYDTPFRLHQHQQGVTFHEVEVPNYPLFRYPPYLLALTNKMIEVSRFCRLDLLHVHYAIPHATSAVLARSVLRERSVKVVTTLHGTDVSLLGTDPGFYDLVAWSINASDGVTAVSAALAEDTRVKLPVTRDIEVIHNFVDPAVYARRPSPALRAALAPAGEALVVHVSNFRGVKRPVDVVRGFAAINGRLPCRLALVGEGPEMPRVRAAAAELGVLDRISFMGHQECVAEILSSADLFLLPSAQESFGLAALESIACGTPVLAYRIGGLPEVIEDGQGGFLLPDNDLDGLVARGIELLSCPSLWGEVGAAGADRARRLFGASRIVSMYEAYYARVLQGDQGKEA